MRNCWKLAVVLFVVVLVSTASSLWAADQFPPTSPIRGVDGTLLRGNGSTTGFYFSIWKLTIALGLFLLWTWTTQWVNSDSQYVKAPCELWNGLVFLSGVIGLGGVFLIGAGGVGGFFLRVFLFLVAYGVPTGFYVVVRNRLVLDHEKVLTRRHFNALLEDGLARMGIRVSRREAIRPVTPTIRFIGKSLTQHREDPGRVRAAEQSRGYVSAKELVYDAILRRATDIHLEPRPDHLAVRYRIDGILHNAEPFDRRNGDSIINIFKVLAALDIAEKRKPQDGSFAAVVDQREIDFRVATQGTMGGEKLSLRILAKDSGLALLRDLGMREKLQQQVRQLVSRPEGMFICCGPTGAGKTTTLYACLREIDRFTKNVITIEDPIEYQLDNVTQIEIHTKAGQSFAKSLRSVLRQDPDVILVGEIRDEETAKIACQSAMTGHMVFTTVHANDSITALFRLLDLSVESYMLSSAVTAILSQRLVRKLCPACKEPYKPRPEVLKKANLPPERIDVFYRPPQQPQQVCPQCGGSGYHGRTGLFELLVITDRIREMIRENPSINAIRAEARKSGMIYLQEDGLRMVIQGTTSVPELMRVVK